MADESSMGTGLVLHRGTPLAALSPEAAEACARLQGAGIRFREAAEGTTRWGEAFAKTMLEEYRKTAVIPRMDFPQKTNFRYTWPSDPASEPEPAAGEPRTPWDLLEI